MRNVWRGLVWIAALLAMVALAVRATLLESWVVPDDPKLSAAIAPTLSGGDTVLFMKRSKPAFGDLVRCTDPDDATHFVIGRVAGLAGDSVETSGAELSVNGTRYTSLRACTEPNVTIVHPSNGSPVELSCGEVEMGGHLHLRGSGDKPEITLPAKSVVLEGKLFLVSDDRAYHDDSRDFGTLPVATCTGRIVFRLWSKDGWKDEKHRMNAVQ